MQEKRQIKRRYARVLRKGVLVVDATEQDIEMVKSRKLELEQLKSTPKWTVYRIKR